MKDDEAVPPELPLEEKLRIAADEVCNAEETDKMDAIDGFTVAGLLSRARVEIERLKDELARARTEAALAFHEGAGAMRDAAAAECEQIALARDPLTYQADCIHETIGRGRCSRCDSAYACLAAVRHIAFRSWSEEVDAREDRRLAEVSTLKGEIERLRAENTALAAERDAERAARRDYESCITLETSCIGCARLLSACRTAEERAEKAEAALVAAQPALQLEAIRAGRIRCEGCGLIVVGGHLACGCCPRCCVCFALEAPHG